MILIDDHLEDLRLFEQECADNAGFEIAGAFRTAQSALSFVTAHDDIALVFLETQLPDMNGLALAARLRAIREDIVVIFVTGHTEHAADALRQKADYVVFKPVAQEDVRDALERARLMQARQRKRVYAKLFGSFDLQFDGRPVHFRSAKAKELMALLICYEGKPLSIHEIVDCLWEGDEFADVNSVGYRKAIKNLTDTLSEYGLERMLERTRGYCRLNTEYLDCDYYGFLRGEGRHRQEFQGVFLPEYAWAEQYIYPMLEMKSGMSV